MTNFPISIFTQSIKVAVLFISVFISAVYSAPPYFISDTVTAPNGRAPNTTLINNSQDTLIIDSVVAKQSFNNAQMVEFYFQATVPSMQFGQWSFRSATTFDTAWTPLHIRNAYLLDKNFTIPPYDSANLSDFGAGSCIWCAGLNKQTASTQAQSGLVVLHLYFFSKTNLIDSLVYLNAYIHGGAIEKASNPAQLKIAAYPNPGRTSINISGIPSSAKSVEILDVSGKMVASFSHPAYTVSWNTHGMASGIYFIKTKTKTALFTKSILVQ